MLTRDWFKSFFSVVDAQMLAPALVLYSSFKDGSDHVPEQEFISSFPEFPLSVVLARGFTAQTKQDVDTLVLFMKDYFLKHQEILREHFNMNSIDLEDHALTVDDVRDLLQESESSKAGTPDWLRIRTYSEFRRVDQETSLIVKTQYFSQYANSLEDLLRVRIELFSNTTTIVF